MKYTRLACLLYLGILAVMMPLDSYAFDLSRPDAHAPISIMGDHTHRKGEWMLSYRFMYMDMEGMRSGDSRVSASKVFANNYTVTPERMTMEMHMFGVMYAPSDRITLMLMAPYKRIEMDHRIFPGAGALIALNNGSDTFTTESEGLGDVVLSGLYTIYASKDKHLHMGLGLSLPTGSIAEKDKVPGPGGLISRQLPATMQLGSGTIDILPSLTFLQQYPLFSYGLQARGNIRTQDENHHDYRLGHRFNLDGWGAWKAASWISLSAGIGYQWEDEVKGTQSDLALTAGTRQTVPTAFGENYGGQRVDILLGVNFYLARGSLKGNRLAVDLRVPAYQDLNGFQLETDYTLTVGWQFAF